MAGLIRADDRHPSDIRRSNGHEGLPRSWNFTRALEIVKLMRLGTHMETIAAKTGVKVQTFRKYRIRGQKVRRWYRFQVDPAVSGMFTGDLAWFPVLLALAAAVEKPDHFADWWVAGFSEACDAAEADDEILMSGIVHKGAVQDPKLALTYLARRYPARWAEKPAVQVNTGAVGALMIYAPAERGEDDA